MSTISRRMRFLLAGVMLVTQVVPAAIVSQLPAARAAVLPPSNTLNNPPAAPIQILVFPQRDFVSASGYTADDRVVVTVQHPNGAIFSTDPATPIVPQADPRAADGAPFAGIVEVNHPGGACWFQTTPDIRPGDKVRITIVANAVDGTRVGRADETTVANVTAGRPVEVDPTTVKVHGTAQDALGNPLPLAQLEQRLVANRQVFLINGRRVLTSAKDGTLAFDPVDPTTNPKGINWTATYTGLQAADVTRALGAESRILWLGANPLAAVEGTIYENGAGVVAGPAAPACTAPLEVIPPPPGSDATPPTNPSGLAATVTNSSTVNLSWTASTDNVGVTSYGIYRDGLPIFNVQNPDGSAPAPTTFSDVNVPPGTYTYTVDAADAMGNRSGLSNAVSATSTAQLATLPPGTIVNEPPVAPVQIISFPSRDFVSNSGFLATDTVQVQVLRKVDGQPGPVVISTSTVIPQADPRAAPTDPFAGIVEVNHPGGGCWDGVTPDIRVGDIIRTIAYNPDGSIRTVDQSHTANVIAERPVLVKNASSATAADGIVEVHGVAMYHDGSPMDLAQVESRLIANRDSFVFNGRRVIRAGGAGKDGTLTYDATDPSGVHWTATYSGLVQQDVDRVMGLNGFPGAQSRALWLGAQPLAGLELTIYENDADPLGSGTVNGPAAAVCSSPSEPFDTQPPVVGTLSAVQSGASSVQLSWTAATDNVAVYQYGIYQDGKRIRNVGATTTSYLLNGVAPGSHTYTVDATDTASPAAQLAPVPNFNSPWGNRSALSNAVPLVQADVTAPSVPLNLVATAGAGQVSLTWSASTDDVGVTSYGVYRGGVKVADVLPPATSYTDTGLAVGAYSYTVDAADAAGNRSAQSAPATANVTAVADTIAPSVPTGLQAAVANLKDVTLTWNASTDNVGVTGYGVYRRNALPTPPGAFVKIADVPAGATPAATYSYTDANVASGTYDYVVDAVDSAANRSAQSAPVQAQTANQPPVAPHSIIAFPQRDFISASGFALNEGPVTVRVIRNGVVVSTSNPVTPQDDPKTAGFDGLVEVNHPGGGCWTVNTPDIRPGDIVRTTTAQGVSDQILVQPVTAQRPSLVTAPSALTAADGVIEVRGTAKDFLTGAPMPVAAFENRLIANKDLFDLNGRRVLRAGGAGTDGTLTIDAAGNWIATYTGLDWNDVTRAIGGTSPSTGTVFVGSESRAVWLGTAPLAGVDLTIYENSDAIVGGPAAGVCTAPQEAAVALSSLDKTSLTFADQATATASPAQTVTMFNVGSTPMTIGTVALVGMNRADFSMTNACPASLAPGASCTVTVTFKPSATGARAAGLDFQDNAANLTGFVALSGKGVDLAAPSAPGAPVQSFVAPSKLTVAATASPNDTIPVTLKWTASASTVTNYQLQMSVNGGAFADVPSQPGTGTSATADLALGTLDTKTFQSGSNTYQFQVRACSGTTCSAWATGPKFNLVPVDDGVSQLLSYNGTWTPKALTGAYGGNVRFASLSTDKVALPNKITFNVSGNIAVIGVKGNDRGKASVSVDGGPAQTIDLYAPCTAGQAGTECQAATVVFAANNLAAGKQHSITIQATGTRNPASTGNRVDLDGLVVLK